MNHGSIGAGSTTEAGNTGAIGAIGAGTTTIIGAGFTSALTGRGLHHP